MLRYHVKVLAETEICGNIFLNSNLLEDSVRSYQLRLTR